MPGKTVIGANKGLRTLGRTFRDSGLAVSWAAKLARRTVTGKGAGQGQNGFAGAPEHRAQAAEIPLLAPRHAGDGPAARAVCGPAPGHVRWRSLAGLCRVAGGAR